MSVRKFIIKSILLFAGVNVMFVLLASVGHAAGSRLRLYIVSSYSADYLWSQDTAKGVGQALLDFKFLDNQKQVEELNTRFYIESSSAVIKKSWMDSKRKHSKIQIADTIARIVNDIKIFRPDLIVLGDDSAVNYIGNYFVDSEVPVVFWGINGLPLKYGLIDSVEHPGHNITGVYQAGFVKESLEYLLGLVPTIKTVAVLSDDSPTSRAKVKGLMILAAQGKLPVDINDTVMTNSYEEWQQKALRFAQHNDAFVIFNHNTLKNKKGRLIEQMEVGAWYLQHIQKPDCSDVKQFVLEGILLVVDDSGFKQGYEALRYANEILRHNKPPGQMPVIMTSRGAIIVNRVRAAQLGIALDQVNFIEEFVDYSLALQPVEIKK